MSARRRFEVSFWCSSSKNEVADAEVDEQVKAVDSDDGDSDEASDVEEVRAKARAPSSAQPGQDGVGDTPSAERRLRAVAREKMKWATTLIT